LFCFVLFCLGASDLHPLHFPGDTFTQPWFVGPIPRKKVEQAVASGGPGAFAIRESERQQGSYVVTVGSFHSMPLFCFTLPMKSDSWCTAPHCTVPHCRLFKDGSPPPCWCNLTPLPLRLQTQTKLRKLTILCALVGTSQCNAIRPVTKR
jgi:hypothetical protein